MKVTRFEIDIDTLWYGFGIELGFIDGDCSTEEQLIAVVDNLTDEQFNNCMARLNAE